MCVGIVCSMRGISLLLSFFISVLLYRSFVSSSFSSLSLFQLFVLNVFFPFSSDTECAVVCQCGVSAPHMHSALNGYNLLFSLVFVCLTLLTVYYILCYVLKTVRVVCTTAVKILMHVLTEPF